MNVIQIAGHVGRDPESRMTPSGQKVTSFSVAVNAREGGQDVTIWYRVSVWGDRFDRMMQYVKKGSGLIIVGELRAPRIYTDKSGQPQVSMELTAEMIRFSPFGRREEQGMGQGAAPAAAAPQAAAYGSQPAMDPGFGGAAEPAAPSPSAGYGDSGTFGNQTITDDNLPF